MRDQEQEMLNSIMEQEEEREMPALEEGMENRPEPDAGTCCCGERRKQRSEKEYKDLINRLSRIEGQIRGIRGMLERDAYCPDILAQAAAANAALNAFSRELLASHIRTCVADDIRAGHDETIEELTALLQRLMR